MVTIGMNYRVLEGKEEIFEAAFERVLEATRGMLGHAETRLYRCVGEPREYLIVSRWEDQTAFESFMRSDRFAKVTNWGLKNILDGPPRHTTYREEL
jgi:heme-degrading monooxygenase HmoA